MRAPNTGTRAGNPQGTTVVMQHERQVAGIRRVSVCPGPCGAIETAVMCGLIGARLLGSILQQLGRAERQDLSVAAVSVFTQAVVVASAEEMIEAELGLIREGLLTNPRAIIASPVNAPAFRRYAWAMATQGVGRYVFTDSQMAQALAWAQQMGGHAVAERAWQARAIGRRTPSGG